VIVEWMIDSISPRFLIHGDLHEFIDVLRN